MLVSDLCGLALDRYVTGNTTRTDIAGELLITWTSGPPNTACINPPVGRVLCKVLAMVAEFEADLTRSRPRPRIAKT